jgi:alpha-1,2-mannosyltransferase
MTSNAMPRTRSRATAIFAAVAGGAIAVQTAVIANRRLTRGGDFDLAREFGRRLLDGEPLYAGGMHYPYMPAAALFFAPLALLPPWLGLALRYVAAVACLGVTLHLLQAMVRGRASVDAHERVLSAGFTVALAAHYIVRDLDDGGPHLILLAMLVAGIFSIWRGWTAAGGAWLGLAAALKAPNALFLPFLLWKRQWRLAAAMAVALAAWTALPLLWMGPASWAAHQQQWLSTAFASVVGAATGAEEESESRIQNQALRPVLERNVAIGPGESLRAAIPALALGALLALFAWLTRRPSPPRANSSWPMEASALLVLSLLFSPVAWVQHLVLLIPALYLIVATRRRRARFGIAAAAAMALYIVFALLLNREIIGRGVYLVLLAHGLHTWCMLLVLFVLYARAPALLPPADPVGAVTRAAATAPCRAGREHEFLSHQPAVKS